MKLELFGIGGLCVGWGLVECGICLTLVQHEVVGMHEYMQDPVDADPRESVITRRLVVEDERVA